MVLNDGYSCKCRKCGDPHNNVNGNGYCKKCMILKRMFSGKKIKKLQGVLLPL